MQMSRRYEQELSAGCQYEPLPSLPETEHHLPNLVGGESYEWAAIDNLDTFFARIYRYWHDKGLVTILIGRLLNLTALAFTIIFSGFLLLAVNWQALHDDCLLPHEPHKSCDLLAVAIHKHPWEAHSKALVGLVGLYLVLCGVYWVWSAVQLVCEMRDVLDVKHFINNKLGISDRQIRMMTWSELLHRLVLVQGTTRLCAVRDLDELDIVGRIMRKENYLIGMLNSGVLALYVRGCSPVLGRRFMLTKTLEWNLYLCILDPVFDEHFHIRQEFLLDEGRLRKRLVAAAAVNLVLSPFLLMFLVIYFFMKHAERFYHSPGSLGSRRWSSLARWRLRELNELPHYVQHRLDASYEAAVKYVGQFPSPLASQIAKFVSFIAGSFAALLLGLSLLDENLLEVPLGGRNVVWWLALTGVLLTISRSFINDTPVAFDPERAMAELVLHTHYLPRHWRGRAHTAEVQQAVNSMFTYKVLLFLEELASVVLTPFILAYSLPRCAGAILQFVSDHTTRVEGVGDICSLAAFDFSRHGNSKYGAPMHADKRLRSKQGKMEKSFLTFVATYPTWQPPAAGRRMLNTIGSLHMAAAAGAAAGGQGPGAAAAAAAAVPASPMGHGVGNLDESVIWQQHGSSAAAAATPRQQQQHVINIGNGSSSSMWVGVADQPPALRHPSYGPQQQQQQQQQLGAQQQQQQPPAAAVADVEGGMGAGLGGLGSSPPDLLTALDSNMNNIRHNAVDLDTAGKQRHSSGDTVEFDLQQRWRQQQGPGRQRGTIGSTVLWQQQQQQSQLPPIAPISSRYLGQSRQQQQQQYTLNRQQQQQQTSPQPLQQQRYSQHYSLLPSQQLLQLYPSTMYPGGPSAAAALSQFGQQYPGGFGLNAVGASLMAGSTSAIGSDFLPTNETEDLSSRVAASQSLLQSFYESQDITVQHRQHNRVHARSVMLGHTGGAAAAAAAVAAMAAASASHHAVPSGEW